LTLLLAACLGAPSAAQDIVAAELSLPTGRYDHAVLGDAVEWGGLDLTTDAGQVLRLTLPESRVFEDVTARLADLDGDGDREVIVVETDIAQGAMLAVYDAGGRVAATAPFGETHRWLAPAGIADLDGDGRIEIAYVDRPHLVRELVIVRLDGSDLVELARLAGLTNHRIGDRTIRGGVRDCGTGPELRLADPEWTTALRVVFRDGGLTAQPVGAISGPQGLDAAMACP
jgi:hypothetical protein